jgi:hypothetical protein
MGDVEGDGDLVAVGGAVAAEVALGDDRTVDGRYACMRTGRRVVVLYSRCSA